MSAAGGDGASSIVALDDAFMSDMRADNPFTRVSVTLSTPANIVVEQGIRDCAPRVAEIAYLPESQRNGNEMRVC